VALLGLGVLIRVGLLLTYSPVEYGDSGSYLRLGEAMLGVGERGYDGTRVPGYPLFMAALGLDPGRIWLGQMGLGLLISAMLFEIMRRRTGNPVLGFILGALYDLLPGQILFEANLLTETLTTFLVVLAVLVFASYCYARSGNGQGWKLVLLGFVGASVGMVRPLFFPVTVLLLFGVWAATPGNFRQKARALALYSIFPVLIQGGWLIYMRTDWNVLSPTAMGGYSLVQHTGGYFEYLPEEDAAIRDTYIEFRDRQVAERGVQTNTIWEAIPAITEASGLGFYELSREMSRLSWLLIREHPVLYLQDVVKGWIDFWKAPVYWKPELFDQVALQAVLGGLALAGRVVSVVANLFFLLLCAGLVISRRVRTWIRMDAVIGMSISLVWVISIVQTLLDHGDNPRFLIPLQMLVFVIVLAVFRSVWVSRMATANVE
jgi:hypothetical protein